MSDINDFIIINGVRTQYNGDGGDVVIPDSVTKIGDDAFSGCYYLTGITLPESVTEIGDRMKHFIFENLICWV